MNTRNILIIVGFSALLSSCDFVTKAYKETFDKDKQDHIRSEDNNSPDEDRPESYTTNDIAKDEKASTPTLLEINLLNDAEKLAQAQQQLEAMFPGKNLLVYAPHISFSKTGIRLGLIDPDVSENIDRYSYETKTGSWQKNEPVKTRANQKIKVIPLRSIQFKTANSVYQQAINKSADIEGAIIPANIFFTFNTDTWNWNCRIEGSRSDYELRTDKDGKVTTFKRL